MHGFCQLREEQGCFCVEVKRRVYFKCIKCVYDSQYGGEPGVREV